MSRPKKRFSTWNALWIIPLALLLAAAVLMYVIPALEGVSAKSVDGSANWMKELPDDVPLSEIVLPGTHDSATEYAQLAFFSKCQALSIREQLDAGYRYLDVRLGGDDGLNLMHGFVNCVTGGWPWSNPLMLEKVLDDCYSFLDENPTETILFCVKYEHGDMTSADFAMRLNKCVTGNSEYWYSGDSIPTVGEARGKLVLLKRFYDEGILPGITFMWRDQDGFGDSYMNSEAYGNPTCTLHVQDRFEYDADEKWAAFTAGMERGGASGSSVSLNFLSTKGHAKYGHPFSFAPKLNKKLADLPNDSIQGWVIVDFASAELADHIYQTNFD